MTSTTLISGVELYRLTEGAIPAPANSSNSTTTRSADGTPWGASTRLACGITVKDPGDDDHAAGAVETSWAFLASSPGPGPLRLGIEFGVVSMRASGHRHNEWGWSFHEVYASLHPFARALYPQARDLVSSLRQPLVGFWNIDLGPQNEAKMRRQWGSGSQDVSLDRSRWDRTLFTFPRPIEFAYAPARPIAKGDPVVFQVGFRLTITAPVVDDYDFYLDTESYASIVWASVTSND